MAIDYREALAVLAQHRGERIVVTTMTAVGLWPSLSDSPLDFHFIPSAMGHATSLGLGLALAQPERGAIVINGDGSLLMNLGSLVTIASQPVPLYVVVMDNELYEVTGGQATAGAGKIDFGGLARAAGIERVYRCDTLEQWQKAASEALQGPGPVLVWLRIVGKLGQKTPKPPRSMPEQIARLRGVLGITTTN